MNLANGDGCMDNCIREMDATVPGDVRLTGGADELSGRVEVFWNGVWRDVCDDGWDLENAHVVCRQLGYSGASMALLGVEGAEEISFSMMLNVLAMRAGCWLV